MADWISGEIKIRGRKSEIIETLKNLTYGFDYEDDESGGRFVQTTELECTHIKWTRRSFLEKIKNKVDIDDHDNSNGYLSIVSLSAKAAYAFVAEEFLPFTLEHKVDIRIHGLGPEFKQDIEILDGEITKDKVTKFDDCQWDCPNIGGIVL